MNQPEKAPETETFCDTAGAGDEITPQAFADETEVLLKLKEKQAQAERHEKNEPPKPDTHKVQNS